MAFSIRSLVLAFCAIGVCSIAMAKLPAPSPEAAAKAAEAAAKAAWAGKVDGYKLCVVQDRLAARYRKTAATPTAPAPCTAPGPFAYTPPESKPIEASGAHSPPGTATSPPSTSSPAATTPAPKS